MRILYIHTYYQIRGGEDQVFEQERDLLFKYHEVKSVVFYNHGGWQGLKQFFQLKYNIKANQEVERSIHEYKPDIVHIHNLHFAAGWGVLDLLKKYQIPVVMTLHNYRLLCPSATLFKNDSLFLDSLTQNFPWNAVKNKVYKNSYILTFWLALITKQLVKNAKIGQINRLIVLTDFAKDLFSKSNLNIEPEKISVKPNFVKKNNATITCLRQQHFLFVGRLSEEKGISVILKAFAGSQFLIKIAGTGPLKEVVEEFSKKYPSNFEYLGKLNSDEVQNEMKSASALIVPSIWLEPFGLVIIEAFSCSLPVIASNLGAMTTLISDGENGLHFEPCNAADLRLKLNDWCDLSDEAKNKIRENAFQTYQEKYTPEINYAMLEKIYKDVIQENQV